MKGVTWALLPGGTAIEGLIPITKGFEKYSTSQRLYEMLPDGSRRYLSDAEIDAARASAKASMDVMCK